MCNPDLTEETLDITGNAPPPPYVPSTLTHGELVLTVAHLKGERDLAREDLRRVLDRVETLVLHGLEWSPAFMVEQLRILKEHLREAVS